MGLCGSSKCKRFIFQIIILFLRQYNSGEHVPRQGHVGAKQNKQRGLVQVSY